ncbi:MAG: transcriptional regulator NrdR [Pseudomonadota bacterium]
MRCPFCNVEDTQVRDSRPTEDKLSVRRRRFCVECESRFTTIERVQLKDLTVIKRNGEKKLFDREKIKRSIYTAIRKRQISEEKIEAIVNSVVREFETSSEGEILTSSIGESIMLALSKIDQVAYVRFASVYKDFNTAADFEDFINKQLKIS